MTANRRRLLRLIGGAIAAASGLHSAARAAQGPQFRDADRTRDKIVAVVRAFGKEYAKPLPTIQQIKPITDVAIEGIAVKPEQLPLMDYFVGDLQLRYSFDDPRHLSGVSMSDLKRLNLKRDELLPLSIANFRRLYPSFKIERLQPHLSSVTGAGELEPSLMLEAKFWDQEQQRVGSAVIAAAPARDALLFSNRAVTRNVDVLRGVTGDLYETAGRNALSKKLYLWNQGRWEVFG